MSREGVVPEETTPDGPATSDGTAGADGIPTPDDAEPGAGRDHQGHRRGYRDIRAEHHAIVRQELLERFGENGRLDDFEDPIRWRRALRSNPVTAVAYRVVIAVVGLALILAGVPMVPLVGPGWAIIFVGLFLWSTEFMWARKVTQFLKAEVKAFEQYSRALPWTAKVPLVLASAAFGWFCFYCALLLTGVPSWTPDVLEQQLIRLPGLG
ncbi:PGPGW domain-containing protein [Janibacter sp. G1551]|uniref:PGPGW domain-containing protein n=1 Tax=Janibacter sp. G1551 TaxID=3420440 RepID=UPI003D00959D